MGATVEEVQRLRAEVGRLREAAARGRGKIEQLRRGEGDATPAALEKRLKALQKEVAALEREYEARLRAYREEYDAKFG